MEVRPDASQPQQTDADEGPSKRKLRKRKLILEDDEKEYLAPGPESATHEGSSDSGTMERELERYRPAYQG